MSTNDDNRYIDMDTIRRDDQRQTMEQIREAGHCPFCRENLDKYHKNPILKEGEFWILTDNQWPYDKVNHQLLAIYRTHIEHITEMAPEAGEELFNFFQAVAREREIPGGGLAMRFGSSDDGNYGSSVRHLHAHLIEPDLASLDETQAWRFKFGQPSNYKKASDN